jgi:hypothetical protein
VVGPTGAGGGPDGPTGATGPAGSGATGATGVIFLTTGSKSTTFTSIAGQVLYYPILGYNGIDPDGYTVSVGAMDQVPGTNYSITAANGGTLLLTTAPPTPGTQILVRSIASYGAGNSVLPAAAREISMFDSGCPASTLNYDILSQQILVFQGNAANLFALNIRGNGEFSLNTVMGIGQALSFVLMVKQGADAAYNMSSVSVDGALKTVYWLAGTPPAGSSINSYTNYSFTILKKASADFLILGNVVSFFG